MTWSSWLSVDSWVTLYDLHLPLLRWALQTLMLGLLLITVWVKGCSETWNSSYWDLCRQFVTYSKIRWAVLNMPYHTLPPSWNSEEASGCFHTYTSPEPHGAPSFPSPLRKETNNSCAWGCRLFRKFWWIISAALIKPGDTGLTSPERTILS